MELAEYYKRQRAWRPWRTIFDALPSPAGQTVLDLGCGVGDQAAELVARGARVIGVDANEVLIREARSRNLPNAVFHAADLREPLHLPPPFPRADQARLPIARGDAAPPPFARGDRGGPFRPSDAEPAWIDGLWCSFTAAYFPDLPTALTRWTKPLRPGGWFALTEIDDFFGHHPLSERTSALLDAYARDALAAGRYDFHMGRKLKGYLEQTGFTRITTMTLEDRELSFRGPAEPQVLDAWRTRLEHMTLLRNFAAGSFEALLDDFPTCLQRADHHCTARVVCCIATR